ncbi:MAG TPA: SMC-Scp complex subunit ScpB [Phycisphaerae bacterium]|nr:SMC-Scp complex subunit ScpB [Phycisphaerae bacterium]
MARNRTKKSQDPQDRNGRDPIANTDDTALEQSSTSEQRNPCEEESGVCASVDNDAALGVEDPTTTSPPVEESRAATDDRADNADNALLETSLPLTAEAPTEEGPAAAAEGESAGEISTERVVEAILFASDQPLTLAKIVSILGTGSVREVRKIIQTLNDEYAQAGRSFRIDEIAGGYQILTLPEYNTWLRRLRQLRQESKLTPAAMETLAVVAYKQPVVRAEIEAVRGVSVGEVLNRLRELGLVKIVGRAEDVGRPMLYGTTRHFLELFGLGSLEDLPAIEELRMPG